MRAIGIKTAEQISIGIVEDHELIGGLRVYPEDDTAEELAGMPAEQIAHTIRQQVEAVAKGALLMRSALGCRASCEAALLRNRQTCNS